MKNIEYANSKINLHLEVLNKRNDGYHNIFSIMASTDLHDLLKLKSLTLLDGENVKLNIEEITGKYANLIKELPIEENLIYKAAKVYFERIGKAAIISIDVEKNIPAGGGLGGGSSDAAAMLRLLNRELKLLTDAELLEISVKIGADVPFCLVGGIAFCEGIGEKIEQIYADLTYTVLIVNNGTHINTKEAYSFLDNRDISQINSDKDLSQKKMQFNLFIKQGMLDEINKYFKNDFEAPVFKKNLSIVELKKIVQQLGADFTIMTGSGSTIIGLFKNYNIASRACKSLLDINKVLQVHLASFA
jgi:4-diphosphocytidyl-2-C-methyl-D-erythritol kinase